MSVHGPAREILCHLDKASRAVGVFPGDFPPGSTAPQAASIQKLGNIGNQFASPGQFRFRLLPDTVIFLAKLLRPFHGSRADIEGSPSVHADQLQERANVPFGPRNLKTISRLVSA
ncbi:hypothetical protein EN833_08435 [Mesorhizobium sp. M4B.F.Ca.ET.190.01.1.1]|uniref:hypothetical protein n=1 Tax=unclassified Mesorhizobium TaxID=325217 RepID=UPI000FE3A4E8|nr:MULTISPECIES: hypothetical protein [unclassified Mesorhizobium]RWX62363.1 hypothetical protein EN780_26890 [Mesorhizobium sp. M4B.F.Ca.ET.089.01.1.1]TGR13185.1 hypothetical protein EN843_08430 [Mesorhizobium sp. M4B.F.Ca.ET.200.01.1.1]TGS21396.1 hypothetical protein EN833_08435 [Mesorhizobium sp. M4B.F.Ca.ET.190.01.1.1]TGT32959.1 hypothetical protein EN815_10975 [Mesorhizobium sp. M4B.F.Ca.ET.172.01.1.1]